MSWNYLSNWLELFVNNSAIQSSTFLVILDILAHEVYDVYLGFCNMHVSLCLQFLCITDAKIQNSN